MTAAAPAFLHAIARFDGADAPEDAQLRTLLKSQHGHDGRRLSRFSLMALAGALSLRDGLREPPAARTGVWLGAPFSSPAKFDSMLQVVTGESHAKPFDFIGNIHNAACFHVAQLLRLNGPSLFLAVGHDAASFAQPLLSALLDLRAGTTDTALVGWCVEQERGARVSGDTATDAHRQGSRATAPDETSDAVPPLEDGCCWWLLSTKPDGAIAQIDILHGTGMVPPDTMSPVRDPLLNPFRLACQYQVQLERNPVIGMPAPLGLILRMQRTEKAHVPPATP